MMGHNPTPGGSVERSLQYSQGQDTFPNTDIIMDTNTITIIQQQADVIDVHSTPKEGGAAVISAVESSQVFVLGIDQERRAVLEPFPKSAEDGDKDDDYEGDSGSDGESDDDEEMPHFTAGRPRAPLVTNQTGPKRKKLDDTTPRASSKSVKDSKKADNTANNTANNTASTSTTNSDTKDSKPKMNKPAVGSTMR